MEGLDPFVDGEKTDMANEHITEAAMDLLRQNKGYATSYVRAVLDEALLQLDEFSVLLPFDGPREATKSEDQFSAEVISAAEKLLPVPSGQFLGTRGCQEPMPPQAALPAGVQG